MRLKSPRVDRVKLHAALTACVLSCLWCTPAPSDADGKSLVLNGIDVLRAEDFKPLAGRRVGLITNHTGLAADGTSTVDLFHQTEACELVAILSPEHGIRGVEDGKVASSVDTVTGLPVVSLYGESRRPKPGMLHGIEALVFDIQDIGARFYTYITTMAYCMEAAAEARIPFYVLDRPNPIGGMLVEGPLLDGDKTSFTGYMPLPVRHGMTVGELARYFNRENGIGAELHVIEMQGWVRTFYYWDTGQVWVNTSPNMRNMLEAILYPGVCLLEQTNVSVGKGTDRPFEMVGAPWIDPRRFAAALRDARPPGIEFVPVLFTPETGTHKGKSCGGVHILISSTEKVHSVLLGFTLISVLRNLYPDDFEMRKVMTLLGNSKSMGMLEAGAAPVDIVLDGGDEMREFLSRRRHALIYGPIQ